MEPQTTPTTPTTPNAQPPRTGSRFPRGRRRGGRPQGGSSFGRTPGSPSADGQAPRRDGAPSGDRRRPRRSRNDRNQRGRRPMTSPALTQRMAIRDPKGPSVAPHTDPDTVRIIPLGGVEEV